MQYHQGANKTTYNAHNTIVNQPLGVVAITIANNRSGTVKISMWYILSLIVKLLISIGNSIFNNLELTMNSQVKYF